MCTVLLFIGHSITISRMQSKYVQSLHPWLHGTAIRKQIINGVVENPVSTIENNLNQLIDWFQVLHGQANGD